MQITRTWKTAAAAALITTFGVVGAAPALAETQSHQDPRGDVTSESTSSHARTKPGVDVVSSTNTYRGSTLTMTVKAAKLATDYVGYWYITTADADYVLQYVRMDGQEQVYFQQQSPTGRGLRLGSPARGIPTCEGVAAKTLRKRNSVVATVPRTCLGGADTVRVGAALLRQTPNKFQLDDARRKGFDDAQQPKLGPALDRN